MLPCALPRLRNNTILAFVSGCVLNPGARGSVRKDELLTQCLAINKHNTVVVCLGIFGKSWISCVGMMPKNIALASCTKHLKTFLENLSLQYLGVEEGVYQSPLNSPVQNYCVDHLIWPCRVQTCELQIFLKSKWKNHNKFHNLYSVKISNHQRGAKFHCVNVGNWRLLESTCRKMHGTLYM